MSVFTDEERDYLSSGVPLRRLATVGPDAMPHVVPTGFRYNQDHDTIDIGGHDLAKRKKSHDVLRNPKVAFVIDDIASVSPGVSGASKLGARRRSWTPAAPSWGGALRQRCSGSRPSAS
jgi:PPOX class F420-dependent enzyme/OxyR family protein